MAPTPGMNSLCPASPGLTEQHFLCGEYCPFFLGVSQPGKMGLLSLEPHSLTPVAPEVL